jgi:DNA invertase Pin-like site-specific DNA recombinase
MRTLLYARVSTNDQNCQLQVTELRRYCTDRAWTVGAEYVDTGFSGANAWVAMLTAILSNGARTIIIERLDRLATTTSRNTFSGI